MKITVVWQQEANIKYKHFSDLIGYAQADKIGKEKGYGKAILIGFSLPFRKRMWKAINDLIIGARYRYPLCCVLNFCIDTLLDRPCAQLRYGQKEYVECAIHIRKHGKRIVPNDLY
jgi:hypothetical protein